MKAYKANLRAEAIKFWTNHIIAKIRPEEKPTHRLTSPDVSDILKTIETPPDWATTYRKRNDYEQYRPHHHRNMDAAVRPKGVRRQHPHDGNAPSFTSARTRAPRSRRRRSPPSATSSSAPRASTSAKSSVVSSCRRTVDSSAGPRRRTATRRMTGTACTGRNRKELTAAQIQETVWKGSGDNRPPKAGHDPLHRSAG